MKEINLITRNSKY